MTLTFSKAHIPSQTGNRTSTQGCNLLSDGSFSIGSEAFVPEAGLWKYKGNDGSRYYKSPGLNKPLIRKRSGTAPSAVVFGDGQWRKEPPYPRETVANKRKPWLRVTVNLFTRHSFIKWRHYSWHPNANYSLAYDGVVTASTGDIIHFRDGPVTLPSGHTLLLMEAGTLLDFDEDGNLCERYQYDPSLRMWSRLVQGQLVSSLPLSDVSVDSSGALWLTSVKLGLSYRLERSEPFTITFDEHAGICCAKVGEPIIMWNADSISQFSIDSRGRIWELSGAQDIYLYTRIGCGISTESESEMEPMPGLEIRLQGTMVVNNRAYLQGEPISISAGSIRVRRKAGLSQAAHIITPTSNIALLYGSDQEWWRGVPRSPVHKLFSAGRYLATDSLVICLLHWVHAEGSLAPGVKQLDFAYSAMLRTAYAFVTNMFLLPFSPIVTWWLVGLAAVLYAVRTVYGVPCSLLSRIVRHVRQSVLLSR